MEAFRIRGGIPLKGTVCPSGSKNAALPILAATLLTSDIFYIDNVPNIKDIANMIAILRQMGVKVDDTDPHHLIIDTREAVNKPLESREARSMRSSYYLMSVFLTRFGHADVALPGGCNFSLRPIDQHIKVFTQLGGDVSPHVEPIPDPVGNETTQTVITLNAKSLKGTHIFLDLVSVGATINAMLAASLAEGETVIEHVAKEPHVVDVANFLNKMGAHIFGAGTDTIRVKGATELHGVHYTVIPDQIEAGTFMVAAAATRGDVIIKGVVSRHMECINAKLVEMGAAVEVLNEGDEESIHVYTPQWPLKAVRLESAPYPGYPTDMMPMTAVLLSLASGESFATEGVYPTRFGYVKGLEQMGAKVKMEGGSASITGVSQLHGSPVTGTDLRAAAAMTLAALAATGDSVVMGLDNLERGYENITEKLKALGADISLMTLS